MSLNRDISLEEQIFQRRVKLLGVVMGVILDRNGEKLVGNEARFSLAVIPSNVREVDQLLQDLSRIIQLDSQETTSLGPKPF